MSGVPVPGAFVASLLLVIGLVACRPGGPQAGSAPAQSTTAGGSASAARPATVEKVSVCLPGLSQGFAYLGIAQQHGYFAELGLDVEVEQVQGPVCTQALSSGRVHFTGAPSALDAIIKGLPYRVVMVNEDRLGHRFVVGRRINSYADLKGGKIAISSPGGLTDKLARLVLPAHGLDPDRDVTLISIGTPENRVAALLSGAIDGSFQSPSETVAALDQGLKTLPFEPPAAVGGAMITTEQLIRSNPDFVARFVRGALMGHLLYGYRKDEVMPAVMKFLSAQDRSYEERVYDLVRPIWREDGALDEQQMRDIIADARQTQQVEREFTPDQVFDFRFVRRAYDELKAANWEGLWSR
ncbi:MAG TPA: ABC transporter substrate-binding protein [Chloroflexota bacterium]|nr:ABC transporter substrate-binding protein [Chloroflexota bacterium]